jgi:hypothetical protein
LATLAETHRTVSSVTIEKSARKAGHDRRDDATGRRCVAATTLDGMTFGGRVRRGEAALQSVENSACASTDAPAGRQTADHIDRGRAAVGGKTLRAIRHQYSPEGEQRQPEIPARSAEHRALELRRRDADDCRRNAIHFNVAADDVSGAIEVVLPRPIADDRREPGCTKKL